MNRRDQKKEKASASTKDAAQPSLDECNIIMDLMGSKDNLVDGGSSQESTLYQELSPDKLDQKLVEFHAAVFPDSTPEDDKEIETEAQESEVRIKPEAEAQEKKGIFRAKAEAQEKIGILKPTSDDQEKKGILKPTSDDQEKKGILRAKAEDQEKKGILKPTSDDQEKKGILKSKEKKVKPKSKENVVEEGETSARPEQHQATAFQFDFGYLDAEVHDLLHQLNSVYSKDTPMPDTPTTKSLYTTTTANLNKIGDIDVILSRVCFIGRLKDKNMADRQERCDAKFTKIRERTDTIFARELGAVTGCLLCYPEYFVLLLEGPEISLMDVVLQARQFCKEVVEEGRVLFIAGQIMTRFSNDWTSLSLNPPFSNDDEESAKDENEKLKLLGEQCLKFWRTVSYAKKNNIKPSQFISSYILPTEQLLSYCIRCSLLRDLHSWMDSLMDLPFSDITSTGRPHVFYPILFNLFKPDSQFDCLGVLGTYDNLPGITPALEAFLRSEYQKKPVETDAEEMSVRQKLFSGQN